LEAGGKGQIKGGNLFRWREVENRKYNGNGPMVIRLVRLEKCRKVEMGNYAISS
jgi:hypothetical protein